MTLDELEKMAQQIAAFGVHPNGEFIYSFYTEQLQAFAALVASAERERLTEAAMKAAEKAVDVAMALEREACAQMLEAASKTGKIISCTSAAKAIRARGQA